MSLFGFVQRLRRRGGAPPAAVTIGVPVHEGARYLEETLAAIRSQSCGDIRLLVSIDRSTDGSLEVARRAVAGDPRCRVESQPRRLGWVENANWLATRAESDFFCLVPQDDILHPDYLAALLAAARDVPGAAVVYADLERFGDFTGVMEQAALLGSPPDRAFEFLRGHFAAVAYRGLVRRSLIDDGILLRPNAFDGFAADSVWLLELAMAGPLVRLPRVLYRKRIRADSVVGGWTSWLPDRALEAWACHCATCHVVVRDQPWAAARRDELRAAVERRLLQSDTAFWGFVGPGACAGGSREAALHAAFERELARLGT